MKFIRSLFFIFAFFCLLSDAKAQRDSKEAILTGSIGLNIWNFIMESVSDSLVTTSTPTFNIMYDYGITRSFSMGGAISYNAFSFINPNYSYVQSPGVIIYERISVNYSIVNIAIRPLYHWGKYENFELYTGARMGFSFWQAQIETTDPYYSDDYYQNDGYSFQVLIGSRAYLSRVIAVNFEVGVLAPYFAAIGISVNLSPKQETMPPRYGED